jgi:hypothetical protein
MLRSRSERDWVRPYLACRYSSSSASSKTTTMLFKMLAIEQAWSLNPETSPKPRQVFVTQSAVLASKVEEYYLQLSRPAQDESRSPTTALLGEEEDKFDRRRDLPATFSGLEDCHFPLFISFHRVRVLVFPSAHSSERGYYSALRNARG